MNLRWGLFAAVGTLLLTGTSLAQASSAGESRRGAAPLPPTRGATTPETTTPEPAKRTAPLPPARPAASRASAPDGVIEVQTPAPVPAPAPLIDGPEMAACLKAFDLLGEQMPQPKTAVSTGACAVPNPVTFQRVRLRDGTTVTLQSPATVRCTFALELATWIRDDLTAILAANAMAGLAQLNGVGSHECRGRNRQSAGPISEHASGNALDLRALKLTDGRVIDLTASETATKRVREEVQRTACARFPTVLGPGSDGFHEDHIHVDSRQRNRGYRLCRWNVN